MRRFKSGCTRHLSDEVSPSRNFGPDGEDWSGWSLAGRSLGTTQHLVQKTSNSGGRQSRAMFPLSAWNRARARLHVFTDAGSKGYGALAYLRTFYTDGFVDVSFVMAKTHWFTMMDKMLHYSYTLDRNCGLLGGCLRNKNKENQRLFEGTNTPEAVNTELRIRKIKMKWDSWNFLG